MASVSLGTTPWFATSALTSDEMRYGLAALAEVPAAANIGSETGVFPSVSGLLVTSASSTTIAVAPGACMVQTTVGGTYVVTVPSSTTVGVTAQATNSRIDLVCVRVLDSEAGDGLGQTIQARILTVEGVAAASPAVPSTPAGYLVIGQLLVNSGGITVTDRRLFTRASGGTRLATTRDTRNGSYPGDVRTWADGRMEVWTGAVWTTVVAPASWTQVNVNYSFTGAGGNPAGTIGFGSTGVSWVRYKLAGKDLTVRYWAAFSGTGPNGGTGDISTVLPPGFTAAPGAGTQWLNAHIWVNDASTMDMGGQAYVFPNTAAVQPQFPKVVVSGGAFDGRWYNYKIADAVGVPGASVPLVGGGFAQGGQISLWGTIEVA